MDLTSYRNVLNRLRQSKPRHLYTVLAFLIPFVGMLMLLMFGGYEPFGDDRSLLYSDMYHQYYPFFVDFRDHLRNGDSLIYNWDIGMGIDYLGLISYYLGSPLNILSVFVPDSLVLEYFSLLMPLKLGLASLFFAIFLKKTFDRNDISIALFGALYGLCAWAVGYQWNIMWLDTFALLPLVVLGTLSVLKKRKFLLYTVTLALSILSNYYIGLFVCIFVFLICICYEICRFSGFKKLFADVGLMVLFSGLAIGITAFLEYPAFVALQGTQSNVNQFPEKFALNMVDRAYYKDYFTYQTNYEAAKALGNTADAISYWFKAFWVALKAIFEGMRKAAGNMGGGVVPTFKEGLPNLYCGIGTIFMAFMYLLNGKFRIRDRICSVLLLLLFMVSFILRQLDYIWHGFHFTNMIPYRFSFLFSFVMLYMAYRLWLKRDTIKLWHILVAAVPTLAIFFTADTKSDLVYVTFNLVFTSLYLVSFLLPKLQKKLSPQASDEEKEYHQRTLLFNKRASTIAVCVIILFELIFSVVNFGVNFPYTTVTNYPKGTKYTESMIRYMKEREDELFYRAEVTHAQTLNDGALNGYHGISTFTSSANVKVTEYTKELGFAAKNTYNRYCYEEGSPVTNLFINLKYLIERGGLVKESAYFEEVHRYGNVYLLENKAYLPLGFLTDPELESINFKSTGDAFYFQNRLIRLSTGLEGEVWHKQDGDLLEIEGHNVEILNSGSSGYASYRASSSGGNVTFTYTADRDGFACINLANLSKKNPYTVSVNGLEQYSETYSLPQMLAVGDVKAGDTVSIRFRCDANVQGSLSISAAILDAEQFGKAYDILNASTLQLTTFEDTLVEGTINCNRDGLLYTSIPQNGNWVAYVDGQKANITLIGDCMIAVPMEAGEHTVTFRYENEAFSMGWKISVICLAVFATICVWVYYPEYKKKKKRKASSDTNGEANEDRNS